MADKKINGSVEITGPLNPNASGYGINLPETAGLQENKTLVTEDQVESSKSITWSALKALKDTHKLIPGVLYRITDYVTTTTQADTRSAGHQFDILVQALDESTLNENAFAIQHAGDTYFANCNLNAWEIKYCLENDSTRFAWADSVNGKGVIYFMKDEWNNECPYDFKNIQFKRYKITVCEKVPDLVGQYLGVPGGYGYTIHENDFIWCYTLTAYDIAGNVEGYLDLSVLLKDRHIITEESSDVECRHNILKNHYTDINSKSYDYGNCQKLNDIVILNGLTDIEGNYSEDSLGCARNTFGIGCYNNTFSDDCTDNVFGNRCFNNTFGNYCYSNTFNNRCFNNTFGTDCSYNTFGNDCSHNIFDNLCIEIIFGNNCSSNMFGNSCSENTFSDRCRNNVFGNRCFNNTFGNYCYNNKFGDSCARNTFGDCCRNNIFGSNCEENKFDTGCNGNIFGLWSHDQSPISFVKNVIIDSGCSYLNIVSDDTTSSSSNYLQNVHIHLGVKGVDGSTPLTLTVPDRNLAYETNFVKAGTTNIEVQ